MRLGIPATLEPLAQLMAYATEADGRVSPEELETLHRFLERRYSHSSRADFLTHFRHAIAQRPNIERIVDGIRQSLPSYEERLDVYATIQTLLAATGLTPEESTALTRIGSLLDIAPRDADLLINAFKPVPEFQFPLNRERVLHIGARPGDPADERDLQLVMMSVADQYAVSSANADVVVAGVGHQPGDIVFIKPGDHVWTSHTTITFVDVSRLFDLAAGQVSRALRLTAQGRALRSVGNGGAGAAFELRVDHGHLWFVKHVATQAVSVNGRALSACAVVVPGDVLEFDDGAIKVSHLLDALDETTWSLEPSSDVGFRYAISNRSDDATAHVLTDIEGDLALTIAGPDDESSPLSVTCAQRECDVPLQLGDTPLRAGTTQLSEPATLRIGHHWFAIDPRRRKVDYTKRVVERFEVRNVRYRFKNAIGLDGITFTTRSGELVAIMGGSGAGKSTLLSVLLGVLPAHEGAVLLNGEDLHEQLQRCRAILGYVPQDDLVMDTLTVEENLLYSGRIRLPHLSESTLRTRVTRVLRDIGLYDKRHLRVGNIVSKVLSGGQRKRLNIGLELLADPELFFLDEPTSGLSSQDSKTIIDLLSHLTRSGKLVFVVIHQPSSDIYKKFDRLLILDAGGVLVWDGPPHDAIGHFKAFLPDHRDFVECPACGSMSPETILNAIEQPASAPRAASATPRKFDPKFWENAFLLKKVDGDRPPDSFMPLPPPPAARLRGKARAWGASVQRAFIDRTRNRTNIVMSVAAPLLLGASMAALLRGPDVPYRYASNAALPKFLFLSTIVFVFFGLMASVNEVIRELPWIRRERIAGAKASQYVIAKTLAFLPFSILQVVIYTALASLILRFPYRAPSYLVIQPLVPFAWYFALVLFCIAQAAFALGLLLSAFLRTQAAAFNWIPLVIIPQILFGGVFIDYTEMPTIVNQVVPEYAELTFSRWGYEALVAGERDFNPSANLNADTRYALRLAYEARGQRFDERALIEIPRARWQSEPAFDTPPLRISSAVIEKTLLPLLRRSGRPTTERALGDAEQFKEAYRPGVQRTSVLRSGLSDRTSTRVAELLMGYETEWWASRFSTQGTNTLLESQLESPNAPEPKRESTVRAWLTDRNPFPARLHAIGTVNVRVVYWNISVLIAMAVGCHILSMLRLKFVR